MSRADGTSSSVMLWGADGLIGQQWRDVNNVVRSSYHVYDTRGNLAQVVDETSTVRGGPSASLAWTAWGDVVPRADGN